MAVMILGTTYSHRHARYLGIPEEEALAELFSFGFDLVRLGCYWDEIQPENNRFFFTKIEGLLQEFSQAGQQVVMVIGAKAPRWPEFYIPGWLAGKSLSQIEFEIVSFVENMVFQLRSYPCIAYWQVENEPLDPSGPDNKKIPLEILKKEVEIVRRLDPRPIVLNMWGNEIAQRKNFASLEELADVVGLDLYYKVPVTSRLFMGPRNYPGAVTKAIKSTDKPIWLSELQAEPWEKGDVLKKGSKAKTMNEKLLRENFENSKKLNPEAIFFWGYEYWYLKKMQGEEGLWNTAKEIVKMVKRMF